MTKKQTSTSRDGSSSPRRRTPGIAGTLGAGLALALVSLFTHIPWAVKVALVATALLGIAGYLVVHVVHLNDLPDPDELEERAAAAALAADPPATGNPSDGGPISGAGPDRDFAPDDKDAPQ